MNGFHVAPLVVLALLAGLAGCQGAGSPETFPEALAASWLGSFNGGDVPGLAMMYSEDAEVLPPDSPVVAGHSAIEDFWQAYQPGQVRIEVSQVDTRKLGDLWYREGAYVAQFPGEGEPRVGKFIELWKKDGNNWLLYRQMWNRNAPPPVAPADEPA
jgi:ketosteroid isomerase-like protein